MQIVNLSQNNVVLAPQNTVVLAAGLIVHLVPGGMIGLMQTANLMNLGPSAVWYRSGVDPGVDDPKSIKLPANTADNGVQFVRFIGLIAEGDTTVAVRLVST